MTLEYTRTFAKDYAKLPDEIRKKLDRQLKNLTIDFRHPSLDVNPLCIFHKIRALYQIAEDTIREI